MEGSRQMPWLQRSNVNALTETQKGSFAAYAIEISSACTVGAQHNTFKLWARSKRLTSGYVCELCGENGSASRSVRGWDGQVNIKPSSAVDGRIEQIERVARSDNHDLS